MTCYLFADKRNSSVVNIQLKLVNRTNIDIINEY